MRMPSPAIDLGKLVYSRANHEMTGVITGYLIRPCNSIQYMVTWGEDMAEGMHWEIELLTEKPYGVPGVGTD